MCEFYLFLFPTIIYEFFVAYSHLREAQLAEAQMTPAEMVEALLTARS
jgi:hypothetical protein